MRIKIDINFKNLTVNKVIKYFIISDVLLLGGWSLIEPIFALFVVGNIRNADLITVGIASAIYWFIKSLVQIPIAVYLDRHDGEKDDFYALVLGLVLAGATAISFIAIRTITALFMVQFLHAFAFALYAASWPTIFSRHLDKGKYSLEWSLNSVTFGISAAVASFLGGIFAKIFGFELVFILAGSLSFLAAAVLFVVPDLILPKATNKEPLIPLSDHTPKVLKK